MVIRLMCRHQYRVVFSLGRRIKQGKVSKIHIFKIARKSHVGSRRSKVEFGSEPDKRESKKDSLVHKPQGK